MQKNLYKNKRILITGASGSIGSALLYNLIKKNCKVIRALSNDENGLFEISEKIFNNSSKRRSTYFSSFILKMKKDKIRILYGDIRDYKRCLEATKNIDIVIHAAAMKHVPVCEFNPTEAIKTNIIGTKNLCKAAIKNKVNKFLLISTDKAADPISIMGDTKKKAEQICLQFNKKNNISKFSCIRFGNVLNSRGSILPLFRNQILNSNSLTLTDPKMTRFFMSLENSVKLILESLNMMRGNEIFILKSMKSFKILDIAKCYKEMFRSNSSIKIIGTRKGEKLSEVLFSKNEKKYLYDNKEMFIINKIFDRKKMKKFYNATKLNNYDFFKSDNPHFIMSKKLLKKLLKNYY